MSFNDRKHILGFIGVPINGVHKNVLPFKQQVFLAHGIPAIPARFPNEQHENILSPTVSYPPDQCTLMMKWLEKHVNATNNIIQEVEKSRGEINGFILENRYRELDVADITKRLKQLNKKMNQIRGEMVTFIDGCHEEALKGERGQKMKMEE